MLTQHIALVPEADGVDASELAKVGAALQKQVMRDLAPAWNITATISTFPFLEDVPVGYWPIIITPCGLGSQAGLHIDRNGQPYAQVEAGSYWSLNASRACLEMLVNPFGNRTVTATSLRSDQGPVEFLVEICGPCADARNAYGVNEIFVSDFCLPAFFETGAAKSGERYSFNGAVASPFQVLPGGHITWYDPVSNNCWVRSHWSDNPVDTELGAIDANVGSMRGLARWRAPLRLQPGAPSAVLNQGRFELEKQHALRASQFRAYRLRALLANNFDAEREAAFEILRTRQDVHELSQPGAGLLRAAAVSSASSPRQGNTWIDQGAAKRASEREPEPADIGEDDIEISPQWLDEEPPPSTRRRTAASEPTPTSERRTSRSSVRPPLPSERRPHDDEWGDLTSAQTEPSIPPPASIPTLAPVVLSVPATATGNPGQGLRARDLALLVAGAFLGAFLIAFAWNAGRSPVVRSAASGGGEISPPRVLGPSNPAIAQGSPQPEGTGLAPAVVVPKVAAPDPIVAVPKQAQVARPASDAAPTVVAAISSHTTRERSDIVPGESQPHHHRTHERPPSPTPEPAGRVEPRRSGETVPESIDELIDTRR